MSLRPSHVHIDAPVLSLTGGSAKVSNKAETLKIGSEVGAVQPSNLSPVSAEREKTIDEIIKTIGRSVHRLETKLVLLTECIQISYLVNWSRQLLRFPLTLFQRHLSIFSPVLANHP